MDCKRVEAELVAFQLAALDGATRAGVETHLMGCGRCVGQFLALKRAVDAGDDVGEGPSELARQRILRAAEKRGPQLAAATLDRTAMEPRAATETARDRRHAQRLYVAVAALLLAAMAPFAWQATHVAAPAKRSAPSLAPPSETILPTEQVDTARLTPDNLRFL